MPNAFQMHPENPVAQQHVWDAGVGAIESWLRVPVLHEERPLQTEFLLPVP